MKSTIFTAISTLLLSAVLCPAGSIAINFGAGRSGSALAAGDSAGVVAQANWNNAAGTSGNVADLLDDAGASSGASLSWSASEEYSTGGTPADANGRMLKAWISANDSANESEVLISGIPYANYDIHIYLNHDRGTEDVAISEVDSAFPPFLAQENDTDIDQPVTFVRQAATAAGDGSQMGNYCIFESCSAASLHIRLGPGGEQGRGNRGAITGIQIVEVAVAPGLPGVETRDATGVAGSTATLNGELTDNGDGDDAATPTIYWGTSDGGTDSAAWQHSSAAGSPMTAPGSFSVSLTGLQPSTKYHFRAFASNSVGDDWAPTSRFFVTPAALPTVGNLAARDVRPTTASLGGNVTETGGETPELKIYYGPNDGGTNPAAWDAVLSLGAQDGSARGTVSGLAPDTGYYFRAAAANSAGTAWASATGGFATPAATAPAVENLPASAVQATFATLSGQVTDDGGDPPAATIYYGTIDGATTPGDWQFHVSAGIQSGAFSVMVADLQPETTYYFRALAANAAGQSWAAASSSFTTTAADTLPPLVINEIHYDEDDKTLLAEFVELYNPGSEAVDLGGYSFTGGIGFTFPVGASIPAGAYAVVAQDPAVVESRFGYAGAFGPFANGTKLSNSGERLVLRNPSGDVVDEVDYSLGFPWPTVGDAIGAPPASPSIELINPALDNDLGGSWRASDTGGDGGGGQPATLVGQGEAGWRCRKGTSCPADDGGGDDWRATAYDDGVDGGWFDATAGVGYGDGDDATVLSDMRGNYITFFLRKRFTVAAGELPTSIKVRCYHDDGAVVWLNGVEVARFSVKTGEIPFPPNGMANNHEAAWSEIVLNGASMPLVEGANLLAIQCINQKLNSSDASLDAEIITVPASAAGPGPTPGARNSVFAANAPPQIRHVASTPEQPASGQDVVVTAKVTDPEGVAEVSLSYQTVDPGDYFCRYLKFNGDGTPNPDPRYEDPANWTTLPMTDDGTGGDETAGDSVFTATLPASLQTNRRLVRYRITARDTLGAPVRVPYADDPQPNFAYFVYDGTPDWTGVIRPGDNPVTYPGDLMSSIPTYFLLSTSNWVDDSQFGGYKGSEYLWPGTLIYDGKVYDHIQYRPRGGSHRFNYGKNFWKFRFGRGRFFQARDAYGRKYKTKWKKLNFSSIVQQVGSGHRGEQGLFEGVGFRLFNLAGVESSKTHYVQFYVVDNTSPTGADQYSGDYYGLFLAIEQMDGRFLDEHDLPDGNLYKIEGHHGYLKNQGPGQVGDGSDVSSFISTYRNTTPDARWWRDNFEIEKYLSYRSIVEGIHQYDIEKGKNYYYYRNPLSDKFEIHPWDLDLTWANNMYGGGNHDFKAKVANNPAFNTDYQNRMREIMDLLYNTDQAWKVVDEFVRDVWTPGAPSLVGADRRLWDNNPHMKTKDRYYDISSTRDFDGMIQLVKDYVVSRGDWMKTDILTQENDVPGTPVISCLGGSDHPTNELLFSSSAYSSPSGSSFAAMEWRIAEVYDPTTPNYLAGDPYIYEIQNPTESGELNTFRSQYQFAPLAARPGRAYRARVRHKDSAGRWSHWSAPVEFTAGEPDVDVWRQNLMITEIMYHPAPASSEEIANGFTTGDFEYLELMNVGTLTLDLADLRFTKGVDFDFVDGTITTLAPGERVLVVRNRAAFESRHGTGLPVAGEWEDGDKLSNSGENLKLSYGAGVAIHEFEYDDQPDWPTSPDGDGPSLTLTAPESRPPLGDPFSWRPSTAPGGSPGASDAQPFSGDPAADADGDGRPALLEHALGSLDSRPDGAPARVGSNWFDDGTGTGATREYLTISYTRNLAADDVIYQVETSSTLEPESWTSDPGSVVFVSETDNGDGTSTVVWRTAAPMDSLRAQFIRLGVSLR